jgi:hypothetical protein
LFSVSCRTSDYRPRQYAKQRQRHLVHFVFVVFHASKAYQTCWAAASLGHYYLAEADAKDLPKKRVRSVPRNFVLKHKHSHLTA